MIEVDRKVRAVGVEGDALQIQRAVELSLCPLLEEQVLALIEPQHCPAIELARRRILGKEDGVVDEEVRKLADDHLHKALVVAVGRRGAGVHCEGPVLIVAERNDLRHVGAPEVKRAAVRTRRSC